jgi:protein-disulfide isomerase
MPHSPSLSVSRSILPAFAALAALFSWACGAATPSADGSAEYANTAGERDSVRVLTDSVLRIADASRITGDSTASVWLIIISDFQCPFCRRFFNETYAAVKREYLDRGRVRMAFINFPSMDHLNAAAAAERALCAGLQRKFWEYHDALFRTFDTWNELRPPDALRHFDLLSGELGLDRDDMQLCQSSGILRQLIGSDVRRAQAAGADATPSFLIGARLVKGAVPFATLSAHIDSAIAEARQAGSR